MMRLLLMTVLLGWCGDLLARNGDGPSTIPVAQEGMEARHAVKVAAAGERSHALLLIGDSITHNLEKEEFRQVWDQYFGDRSALCLGYSGARTENILWNLANGELEGQDPKVAVILIGTNNIGHIADERPEWTAAGIRKVVRAVQDKSSDAKVLLLAVFPRDAKGSRLRKSVEAINQMIARLDDGKRVRFLDLTAKFTDADGEIQKDLMPDKLHPNAKGYQVWAEAMQPLLAEMMK